VLLCFGSQHAGRIFPCDTSLHDTSLLLRFTSSSAHQSDAIRSCSQMLNMQAAPCVRKNVVLLPGEWPTAAGGVSLPQLRAPVQDHQLQHQPMELGGSGGGGGPPPGWHSPWHDLPGGLSGLQRSPTQDAAGGLAALYGQLSGGAQQQLLAQSAYSSCFASSGGCGGSTGSFGALAGGGVGGSGLDSGGGRPPLPRFSSTRRSAPAELQHEIQRGGSASCGSGCGLFSVSADPATGVMADWGAAYAPPAGQRGSAVDAAALRLQHSPQGRRAALSPLAGLGAGGLGSDGFDGSGSLGSSGGGGSGGLALLGARPAQPDSWTHYSGMDAGLSGLGLTGSGLSTHSMPTSFLSPLLFELGTQRPSDGQYQAASQLEHVVGESSWPLAGGADADCVGFLPPAGFGLVGRAGSMPGAGFGSGPSGAAGGSQGLPPLPLIAVRRRTASGCLLGDVAWGGGAASGERSVRASPPPARPQQRLGRRKSGRHAASSSDSDADWRPEAEEGSGGSGGLLDGGFGSGRGGMGGGNAMPPAPGLTRRTSWHATAAEAMAAAEAAALNPGDRPKARHWIH